MQIVYIAFDILFYGSGSVIAQPLRVGGVQHASTHGCVTATCKRHASAVLHSVRCKHDCGTTDVCMHSYESLTRLAVYSCVALMCFPSLVGFRSGPATLPVVLLAVCIAYLAITLLLPVQERLEILRQAVTPVTEGVPLGGRGNPSGVRMYNLCCENVHALCMLCCHRWH